MKTPKQYREMEFQNILVELVRLLKPKTYVEVGVKKGYTFNAISSLVQRAVAVDINNFVPLYPSNVLFYQMTSKKFAEEWAKQEDTTIDFLFIDADHNYKSVISDFDNLSKFVPNHMGLIFLHDTYPVNQELLADGYCSTAWKAAKEIYQRIDFEIITFPGPWAGMSIIRKVKDNSGYVSHGWMDRWDDVWIEEGEKRCWKDVGLRNKEGEKK